MWKRKVWGGYCLALRPPTSHHGAASSTPHSCLSQRKHQAASGCRAEEMAGPLFPSLRQILKSSKQMAMLILLLDIYFVAKLENSQENGKVTFFPYTNLLMGGIMGRPVCWNCVKHLQIASAEHYRLSD